MKITKSLLVACLITVVFDVAAQTGLKFDKRFVQSEDKWVAFPMDKDSAHTFGFIYIDAAAGLTIDVAGHFTVSSEGNYIPVKFDSTRVKVRLEANNVLVAWIPANKFDDLKIEATPAWLSFYKTDTTSVKHLYNWGFMYNGWGECGKALTYLEKALNTDPAYKGLKTELAFSYNCLHQYDKAITVLEDILNENPSDSYTTKEYVYSLVKSRQYDKAAESIRKAIELSKDQKYLDEMCYNLLYEYYANKDKTRFDQWAKETKKWYSKNKKMNAYVDAMKKEMKNLRN